MRYNITYRAARRKEARKAYQQASKDYAAHVPWTDYWKHYGERYISAEDANGKPTEKRRLGITAKQAATKSYTSNGDREVARRMRRINKEK